MHVLILNIYSFSTLWEAGPEKKLCDADSEFKKRQKAVLVAKQREEKKVRHSVLSNFQQKEDARMWLGDGKAHIWKALSLRARVASGDGLALRLRKVLWQGNRSLTNSLAMQVNLRAVEKKRGVASSFMLSHSVMRVFNRLASSHLLI